MLLVSCALAACNGKLSAGEQGGDGSAAEASTDDATSVGGLRDAAALDATEGDAAADDTVTQNAPADDSAVHDAPTFDATEGDAAAAAPAIDATAADAAAPGDGGLGDAAADATADAGTLDEAATDDAGTPGEGSGEASCGGDPSTAPITITGSIANVPAGTTQIFLLLTEGVLLPSPDWFGQNFACGNGPNTQTFTQSRIVPPSQGTFTFGSGTPLQSDGGPAICSGSFKLEAYASDANSQNLGSATVVCGEWDSPPPPANFGGPAITSTCVTCNVSF